MQSLLQRLLLGNAGGGGGGNPTLNYNFVDGSAFPSAITFSRGTNATQFDSSGNLVYAPANLLVRSEDFATTWTNAGDITVTVDVAISPSGNQTADKIAANATTNVHGVQQVSVAVSSGAIYTFSCFAKAAGYDFVWFDLFDGSNRRTWFNLNNGTVGTNAAGSTASIQSVGNGWYRCVISRSVAAASVNAAILTSNADNVASFLGDGTSGIFLWGAQLNPTPVLGGVTESLSTYYPTTASAYYGPRLDYDPVTLAAQGLLIEEQRTNSIRNSTMQGAVAGTPGTGPTNWSVTSSGSGLTREIVGVGTSNGITYVRVRYFGTATVNTFPQIYPEAVGALAASVGQTWSGSWFLRYPSAPTGSFGVAVETGESGGTTAVTTINPSITSSFQRFSVTRTLTDAATTSVWTRFVLTVLSGSTVDITIDLGLPQLEQGAFATSVIPTTTTALTRNADVATVSPLGSWYNATAGTLFAEYIVTNSAQNNSAASLSDNTNDNRMLIRAANSSAQTVFIGVAATVTQWNDVIFSALLNTPTKSALAYATNDIAWVRNGGAVGTDTSATIPTVNRLQLGLDGAGTLPLNGYLRRLTYYPVRLTNAALQQITT